MGLGPPLTLPSVLLLQKQTAQAGYEAAVTQSVGTREHVLTETDKSRDLGAARSLLTDGPKEQAGTIPET